MNSLDAGNEQVIATYNFAYLDEQTKRMIRRALLKGIAVPGYQVPFASREMPMPYGWGTGGVQVTAAIIGPDDRLKVIDQGADDTTNAISIRKFFERTTGVETTTATAAAVASTIGNAGAVLASTILSRAPPRSSHMSTATPAMAMPTRSAAVRAGDAMAESAKPSSPRRRSSS